MRNYTTYYDVATDDGFEKLYRRLTGQHDTPRPSVGKVQNLHSKSQGKARPRVRRKVLNYSEKKDVQAAKGLNVVNRFGELYQVYPIGPVRSCCVTCHYCYNKSFQATEAASLWLGYSMPLTNHRRGTNCSDLKFPDTDNEFREISIGATGYDISDFHLDVYSSVEMENITFKHVAIELFQEVWIEPNEEAPRSPKIFICYSRQDARTADDLYVKLKAARADPWLDKRKLVLGDDWKQEIQNVVLTADAVVVCLRPGFDETGFRQREIRWALDALSLRPVGRGFIIPFIVEPCSLPDWCKQFHAAGNLSQRTSFDELVRAIEQHTGYYWR